MVNSGIKENLKKERKGEKTKKGEKRKAVGGKRRGDWEKNMGITGEGE